MPFIRVGGIRIGVLSRSQWAVYMAEYCLLQRKKAPNVPVVVFSANGQIVTKYNREPYFKALIDQADAVDADGQPLVWASKHLTRTPLPERVATTDFFHDAAAIAQKKGLRFYFLGANPQNIEVAIATIRKLYPKLIIAGYRNGYFKPSEESQICAEVVKTKPDVLWVGLGAPLQEAFVLRNKQNLMGVAWIKTCGGLFDYFTPDVKRAPMWMQNVGLEWLFRTIQEPRKYFWRYFTTNGFAAFYLLTRTHTMS